MSKRIATGCLVLVLVCLAACAPDFDSASKVKDLRVLAIQMNPPEFIYPSNELGVPDAEAYEQMYSLPTSMARILVANPLNPDELLEYEIQGCLVSSDDLCTDSPEPLLYGDGAYQPGILEVSTYYTPSLIEAAFERDPATGIFGAATWIRGEIQSGEETVTFLKSQLFSPNYAGQREVNENPSFSDILLGEEGEEAPIVVHPDGYWETLTDTEYRLVPVIPEEAHQDYIVMTFDAELKELTEEMTVNFYGTCGEFKEESTSEVVEIFLESKEDQEEPDLSNVWTSPEEPVEDCTLWFVVTDGRGGIGWWRQNLRVE